MIGTVYSDIKALIKNRGIVSIVALFALLEIIDASLTFWAVSNGLIREGNSLIANIAGNLNFLLLKTAGALISALIVLVLYKYFPRLSLATGISIIMFYFIVLTWNTGLIISTLSL